MGWAFWRVLEAQECISHVGEMWITVAGGQTVFSKDAHNNTSCPTCSSRILPLHYQEMESSVLSLNLDGFVSCLEPREPSGVAPGPGQKRWCSFHLAHWNMSSGCLRPRCQQSHRPEASVLQTRPHGEAAWPSDCSCMKPETSLPRLSRIPDPQKLNKMAVIFWSC